MDEKELDILRKCKIMIGTPMYGGMCCGAYTVTLSGLVHFCAVNGIRLHFSFVYNESLITRARNNIAYDFLKSDCTHLMFIDADTRFDIQDVLTLACLDKDVVSAAIPKKLINWENVTPECMRLFAPQRCMP